MKTKKQFNERLLKLAKHLESTTNHPEFGLTETARLIELSPRAPHSFMVVYPRWVFEELPAIFDEWFYDKQTGNPICDGADEEEGTLGSAIYFFDLSLEETCHLFDLEGKQNVEAFGGLRLNFESDGPELAQNILALVATRMSA